MKNIKITESRLRRIIREELMNEMFSSTDFSGEDANKVADRLMRMAKAKLGEKFEEAPDAVKKVMGLLSQNKSNKGFLAKLFSGVVEKPDDVPLDAIEAELKKKIDPRAAAERRKRAGA
jgi:hypothetical protein